jgi:outer membrane protein TolC
MIQMKRNYLLLLILFCIGLSASAQLTLDDCQRLARENYPLIKQLNLIEKSRKLNLSNVARSWLPQFGIMGVAALTEGIPDISLPGSTAESSNHQLAGIASLTQTVWDGGNAKARRRIANASADVEAGTVEVELYQVRERINQIYFGVLLIDRQLKQNDILTETLSANLKRAETAALNGAASQSDIDKIQVEILNAEQTRINLQAYRTAYVGMLAGFTGREIPIQTSFVEPEATSYHPAPEINRPELRLFDRQRSLNDANNSLLTSSYLPKVGLNGYAIGMTPGITIGGSKLDHILVAGLSLSWNIGGLYTQANDRNRIKLNNRMIDARQETMLLNTRMDITRQNSEIERCRQLISKDAEILLLRERIKNASETKYENGACTTADLLNDINAENLARQVKAHHEIEFLMYLYTQKTTAGN